METMQFIFGCTSTKARTVSDPLVGRGSARPAQFKRWKSTRMYDPQEDSTEDCDGTYTPSEVSSPPVRVSWKKPRFRSQGSVLLLTERYSKPLPAGIIIEEKAASTPTTSTVREEWNENPHFEFPEEMELVPSSDDELEFKKYEIPLSIYEESFFKMFSNKLRKNKHILKSHLPKWGTKGVIMQSLKTHGTLVWSIAKELSNCQRMAKQCFNFQRFSYIVCAESEVGSNKEGIQIADKRCMFTVNRYSIVNSLCLWDFATFWDGELNFQAATDASPYLSLTAGQWKDALMAERTARWIMMYEPIFARSLRNQGIFAQKRAGQLEEIHNTSKLMKLVLAEFIYMNGISLKYGQSFSGHDVLLSLEMTSSQEELFRHIPEWVEEFETYDFLLNPENCPDFLELIPDSSNPSSQKRIFLCDPLHWTIHMRVLLEARKDALISLLDKTRKFSISESATDSEAAAHIKKIEKMAKGQISRLRSLLETLPKLQNIEEYIFRSKRSKSVFGSCRTGIQQRGSNVNVLEEKLSPKNQGNGRTKGVTASFMSLRVNGQRAPTSGSRFFPSTGIIFPGKRSQQSPFKRVMTRHSLSRKVNRGNGCFSGITRCFSTPDLNAQDPEFATVQAPKNKQGENSIKKRLVELGDETYESSQSDAQYISYK